MVYVPQVLIVEDEPAVRYLLGRALTDDGFAVTGLGTAREALRAVQDVDFEVIIVDMSLPDADGIDVIRQIHGDVPHVQVLAISGMMVADVLRAVRSAGAAAALMKPATGERVREVIHGLLNSRSEASALAVRGRGRLKADCSQDWLPHHLQFEQEVQLGSVTVRT